MSPIFYEEMYGTGALGWILFTRIWFNGEPYEYTFEVGAGTETETQARDNARRLLCRHRTYRNFLRDLPLDETRPN